MIHQDNPSSKMPIIQEQELNTSMTKFERKKPFMCIEKVEQTQKCSFYILCSVYIIIKTIKLLRTAIVFAYPGRPGPFISEVYY